MPTLLEVQDIVNARARGRIKGTVRLVMPDIGALWVDETGARISDDAAEITLTARSEVFHNIVTGTQNPATAFMTGKLKVDGNPMRALKIGEILSTEP